MTGAGTAPLDRSEVECGLGPLQEPGVHPPLAGGTRPPLSGARPLAGKRQRVRRGREEGRVQPAVTPDRPRRHNVHIRRTWNALRTRRIRPVI